MKELLDNTKERMGKCITALESELNTIRAGRADPRVLDRITVEYYGTETPVNQMASISVAEARILVVSPYDATSLKAIEKAIQASDLGINPTNDGKCLRIVFPQLTEERRKELSKQVSKTCEDSKVAVRNVRRDALDKLKAKKKANEITEDDQKDGEKNIQKLTDKFIEEIDKIGAAKEKEIMSI
ncbi:MAG: ribosome recycling factor [Oscillospiraceae bacterium]